MMGIKILEKPASFSHQKMGQWVPPKCCYCDRVLEAYKRLKVGIAEISQDAITRQWHITPIS
jgi:hypothetical protein